MKINSEKLKECLYRLQILKNNASRNRRVSWNTKMNINNEKLKESVQTTGVEA